MRLPTIERLQSALGREDGEGCFPERGAPICANELWVPLFHKMRLVILENGRG